MRKIRQISDSQSKTPEWCKSINDVSTAEVSCILAQQHKQINLTAWC